LTQGRHAKEAPLFVQSMALARWLFENLRGPGVLVERIQRDALRLLDEIVLALKDVDRDESLARADTTAALLRVHLRLGQELGAVDERQLVFLTGELDAVGRQIGGWQRRLAQDRLGERHR
jgi:hypothetical protein